MAQASLKIKPHLASTEVEKRYKTCKDARIKSRWQLIWLMQKHSLMVIPAATAVGMCQRWARQLVHRYNQEGPKGIEDKRKDNSGQKPCLSEKQKQELKKAITSGSPSDKGLWTSVKVADWIKEKTGIRPDNRTGLNYLKSLGFSLQVPRPCHVKAATEEEKLAFKKTWQSSQLS